MRRHLFNIHLLSVRWCTMAILIISNSTSHILLILRKLFLRSRFNPSARPLRPRRIQVRLNKGTSLGINNLCVRLQTRGVVLIMRPPTPPSNDSWTAATSTAIATCSTTTREAKPGSSDSNVGDKGCF